MADDIEYHGRAWPQIKGDHIELCDANIHKEDQGFPKSLKDLFEPGCLYELHVVAHRMKD